MTVSDRVEGISRVFAFVTASLAFAAFATSAVGQTWTVTPIGATVDLGWHADIDADAAGLPRGACSANSASSLWYGQSDGSTWSTEYPSLSSTFAFALDNTGRPHVAYSYVQSSKVYLGLASRNDAGTWDVTPISTPTGETPIVMALDFDSQNFYNIAYKDTAGKKLKRIQRTALGWNFQTVASHNIFISTSRTVNMMIDANDAPHFVWSDIGTGNIYHTRWNGSSYKTLTLGTGIGKSMAFDASNNLHVCYAKDFSDVTHTVFGGTSWTTGTTVATNTNAGDVAIDLLGRPHIVYLGHPDSSTDAVQHAAWTGTAWTTQNVTQWTSAISGPEVEALAIDGRNRMHVLFADDNMDLYYATCDLGRQLAITPAVDFDAVSSNGVNFTVTDGSYDLFSQQVPAANIYKRAVMEFSLSSLPDNLWVESATLTLDIDLYTGGSSGYPSLRIYGYSGDGVMSTADPTQTAVLIGQSAPITALDPITIELDADFVDSLVCGGASHLGLVAFDPVSGKQVGFYSKEGTAYGQAPTLTLAYALRQYLIPGDATGNGVVDDADAAVLAAHWGTAVGNGPANGDFNRDGLVDAADASILAANWGSHTSEGREVPEPAAAVLLFGLIVGLVPTRRRVR